jgi:hypothetical protein
VKAWIGDLFASFSFDRRNLELSISFWSWRCVSAAFFECHCGECEFRR